MKNRITNLTELQAEIARLQNIKREQEAYLQDQLDIVKEKINKPIHFFQNMFAFLPSSSGLLSKVGVGDGAGFHEDWLTKSLKIGLPFLVNRVFFRKAGYVKKILMGLVSTQAAGFLNKERLAGVVDTITSWIKKSPQKNRRSKPRNASGGYDFGIPPDSETY